MSSEARANTAGPLTWGPWVRVHNHAQNFTGMVMHSGTLEIHGDVGKVTGYSAKGGTFNILGNVVDRGWVCAVSDPRGPGLQVNIVGTAYRTSLPGFHGRIGDHVRPLPGIRWNPAQAAFPLQRRENPRRGLCR